MSFGVSARGLVQKPFELAGSCGNLLHLHGWDKLRQPHFFAREARATSGSVKFSPRANRPSAWIHKNIL
jgi:hypothetical protein